MRLPEPGDQVEPVGVGHVSVGIADGLDISRAVDREAVLAVVVVDALVEDLDVLLRTDVFAAPGVGKLRDAEAVVDLDLRFALAALLGGDQHDAVGGARAVDRGRSGVLQHLDRLDVREVERRQRTHVLAERIERRRVVRQRNAVDHVKRLVAGAERRRTADAHLLGRAEVTRTGRDRHAGDAALKEFRGRHHAAHVLLGGLELADGVGHQAAALRAVTDHDHLVEGHVVVFEPDHRGFPLFFISASGSAGSLFFRIYPHFDRGARPLVDLPLFGAQAASGIGDPHLDPEGPGRVDFVVRGQRVGNYI